MSIKDALLEIWALSLFVTFSPQQQLDTYNKLKEFLAYNVDKISSIEYYNLLELNFYLALIIGKDVEALSSLNKITDMFDEDSSQRIAVLRATYLSSNEIADGVGYLLKRDKEELLSLKKRIALTKGFLKPTDYVESLKNYLKYVPLDIESIAELAEAYSNLGHYDKAIFNYEDVLLVQPFNYIVFGKIGELYFKLYKQKNDINDLDSGLKNFLRSVELSSNFVQGWSGIYVISKEISSFNEKKLKEVKSDYKKLLELSESKLNDIIKASSSTYENIENAKKILKI